jgi:hypothetical protein
MITIQMKPEYWRGAASEMAASPVGIINDLVCTRNANQVRKAMDCQIGCHPPAIALERRIGGICGDEASPI